MRRRTQTGQNYTDVLTGYLVDSWEQPELERCSLAAGVVGAAPQDERLLAVRWDEEDVLVEDGGGCLEEDIVQMDKLLRDPLHVGQRVSGDVVNELEAVALNPARGQFSIFPLKHDQILNE